MLSDTPWKTDSWFTSPWNFADEVRSGMRLPEQFKIHDVTLRDGEQQTGITFTREEKVDLARRLDAIGVHRIEAGMPAVSPQDEAAIKEIVDLDQSPAENLKQLAKAKKKDISDLIVCILDRPRHQEIIEGVREAGSRVLLIGDGDVSGVMATSRRDPSVVIPLLI